MNPSSDPWYIRLPDGRVLRAGSTAAVRHHLESGQIPLDSRLRRSPLEAWTVLEKIDAFMDLVSLLPNRGRRSAAQRAGPTDEAAGRAGGLQLQTLGVGGLATDLLTALDSTLVRSKLQTAALAGLAAGLTAMLGVLLPQLVELPWPWLLQAGQGVLLLAIAAYCTAVLSHATYVELAHFRAARWSEAMRGLHRNAFRLLLAYLVVVGGVVLVLVLLRWLPDWLLTRTEPAWLTEAQQALAATATVLQLVLAVALWPVLGFALLLGPVIVVEECGVLRALRQWIGLLRAHLSRIFLYEALAAAIAVAAALPFVVPVELAAWTAPTGGISAVAAEATVLVLRGLALTPLLAYLAVANVFIYLNLRYEHTPAR